MSTGIIRFIFNEHFLFFLGNGWVWHGTVDINIKNDFVVETISELESTKVPLLAQDGTMAFKSRSSFSCMVNYKLHFCVQELLIVCSI